MTDFTPLDITWLLISAFLVMTMQIGFCMLETGLVRSKNSINVAFKNVMDFVVASLTFWAIGYGLMYGASISGMLGSTLFFVDHKETVGAFFIYQMMFCGAAATIVGGAIAERTRFSAYIIISIAMAAVLYHLSDIGCGMELSTASAMAGLPSRVLSISPVVLSCMVLAVGSHWLLCWS